MYAIIPNSIHTAIVRPNEPQEKSTFWHDCKENLEFESDETERTF